MARGVQITIVTSVQGRCRFVDSLNGVTIGIFFENEEIRLYICIIVEQQYLFISWNFWFISELGIGVSDIWSTPIPHAKRQNSAVWK